MRKLRPGCSIHRVRGRSGFELRPSGFKKAVHVSATTLQHFRWAGNLAITESKPVILQLRKQQPTERAVLAPNPQGMGSRAGLRRTAVAESQRWGQGCGPSCTAPPHPAPNTKCPFFPFWEWVQRVGGWGGRVDWKPPGCLHSPDSQGSHCPGRNAGPAALRGRGLIPSPRQACFVLSTQGPSRPSPASLLSISQDFQARLLRDEATGKGVGLGRCPGP